MKNQKKKHSVVLRCTLIIFAVLIAICGTYLHFGGFGTGESADTNEFAKFAVEVSDIEIPEEARIIALGEATHGNAEFQRLKLDVFKVAVEKYGVRAFALEADYGCCEAANRYIHGGEGTAETAADALGFQIYQTDEMANLLEWMRNYNEKAAEGEDLCFYGFDMQKYDADYRCLVELAKALGADTKELEKVWGRKDESGKYTAEQKADAVKAVKSELINREEPEAVKAAHFADVLLQNVEMGKAMDNMLAGMAYRDKAMAENVKWILRQEETRGNSRIFISGHNGHVDKSGSYDENNKYMGHILADDIGENLYFAIGTDFYKSTSNMPKGNGKRTTITVYSKNPLAKAAMKCGYDICRLDFSKIPEDSALKSSVDGYCYMGNLGENQITLLNRVIMKAVPYTYRLWGSPAAMYDGMIFVANAHPTEIKVYTGNRD